MEKPLNDLEELGRHAAAGLDAYAPERARAIQRAQRSFLDAALSPVRSTGFRLRPALLVPAFAAALVTIVALFLGSRPPPSLAFTAGSEPGVVESWVAAPEALSIPLRFSDGTVLDVAPASRARVVAIDAHGASVALETGRLHANVVHTGNSHWRVIAGPLTVHVTGTRFDVRWSAATEEFSVSVEEGSVTVSGSVVGSERPVRAGETLRVRVADRRLDLTNSNVSAARREEKAVPEVARKTSLEDETPSPEATVGSAASRPSGDSRRSSAPERPAIGDDWREFARRGALREAFAAAEASGFEAACQSASASELLQLGDGARLAGRPDRARVALLTLRRVYPSDPRRAAAAFSLGKVAFDQNGAYAQAAEWFKTSIREQPNGSLSREAAGRLIEALKRSGDAAGARRAAEDYLARYPNGPHADLARGVTR